MARIYKNWIHDFVETVSPKSESPKRFLYWAAVSTVSGAIRRRVYLDMGHFQWHPNWYIVLVGPPGLVKKSTSIDIATKILRGVQGVIFGPDCVTWQQFVTAIADAQDNYAVGHGTSMDDQEYAQSCAITFTISEFGTLFDANEPNLINMMTEFWDGKDTTFRKATKTQGEDVIKAPFVNIIAGTTPRWIADNFSAKFAGWGLSSRIVFLHADDIEQLIPFPDEVWGDEKDTWSDHFLTDLQSIATMQGAMKLTGETREIGRAWYKQHMERVKAFGQQPGSDEWVGYFLQRKFSHIFKLAMVLSISEGESYTVEARHLAEAIREIELVETELPKVFRTKRDVDKRVQLQKEIGKQMVAGITMANGKIKASLLYKYTYNHMVTPAADQLLAGMVKAGILERVQEPDGLYYTLGPSSKDVFTPAELQEIEEDYAKLYPPQPLERTEGPGYTAEDIKAGLDGLTTS